MMKFIQSDKFGHFLGGYFLYDLTTDLGNVCVGLLVCFVISLVKELSDKYLRKSNFDWLDILAGVVGGVLNLVIWQIL